jgi:hypothetical protein
VRQWGDTGWLAILPIAVAVALVVLLLRTGWPVSLFPVAVIVAVFVGLTWGYLARPLGIQEILAVAGRRTLSTLVLAAGVFLPVLGAELSRTRRRAPSPASARSWRPWSRSSTTEATNRAASP